MTGKSETLRHRISKCQVKMEIHETPTRHATREKSLAADHRLVGIVPATATTNSPHARGSPPSETPNVHTLACESAQPPQFLTLCQAVPASNSRPGCPYISPRWRPVAIVFLPFSIFNLLDLTATSN